MGIFRHSSAPESTDTIPASTTLSARPHFPRRTSIAAASVLTCAGVFYVAVNAGPAPSASVRSAKPASHSSLQLSVDQQTAASATPTTDTSTSQSQTSTSINASTSGDNTANASVTVNGQPIDIPPSGKVSKTIVDSNGVTSLQVNSSSEGSSFNSTFTSLNVNVNSTATSFNDNSP
ncbi:MAG: hypothetical protein ABIO22_01315 [Candidatus Saccharimonadales bacterium]